jgi:hypothetical protein
MAFRSPEAPGSPLNGWKPGRKSCALFVVVAVGVAACSPPPERPPVVEPGELPAPNPAASGSASAAPGSDDLVFVGTVTSIAPADTRSHETRLVVNTRVERVLSGSFSGSHFSFAVHSPAKSGLEVGKQCSIRARRTPDGYRVDKTQWFRRE